MRRGPARPPASSAGRGLVAGPEPSRPAEFADKPEQRAVLVIGRAGIAQAKVRLGPKALPQFGGDAEPDLPRAGGAGWDRRDRGLLVFREPRRVAGDELGARPDLARCTAKSLIPVWRSVRAARTT